MFLLAIPQELTLLTDVGVYYPIGPTFCGAELLIISEARPQPRRGGRWRVWLWRASADGHLTSPLPFWDLGTRGGGRLGPAPWGPLEEVVGLFLPALFDLVVRALEGHLGVLDDWMCSGPLEGGRERAWERRVSSHRGRPKSLVSGPRLAGAALTRVWLGVCVTRGLCVGVGECVTVRRVCGSQALG